MGVWHIPAGISGAHRKNLLRSVPFRRSAGYTFKFCGDSGHSYCLEGQKIEFYRCGHPAQQHGLLFPSKSSSFVRLIRRSLVSSFFASRTQQINSLRASGVISFQALRALGFELRTFCKSAGILCTCSFFLYNFFLHLDCFLSNSFLYRKSQKGKNYHGRENNADKVDQK